MICEIIPEKRTSPDKDTFTYKVPADLESDIQVGSIANIPFGNKTIRGVLSKLSVDSYQLSVEYKLKEILSVNSEFIIPKQYIEVAKWISEYYLCSLGEAMALFLPPKFSQKRKSVISNRLSVISTKVKLNTEQSEVFSKLTSKLDAPDKPALLFGVTGSGKTEIYIKLAEEVLRRNKQVIVLTPEIMLTPQIVDKFEECFPGLVCLMHSGLSASQKYNSYKEFYNNEKKIIIGPRSALLVPSNNLGLIIIDEEQEDAYKQEKDPRYNAVSLAEVITKNTNSMLLLGSATPRIETYHKAIKGEYELFNLKNRYQKMILPTAEIVDLRNEIKYDNLSPISLKLQSKIKETLDKKRQIILFLNRRGMATFVSCRECGEVILCPNCSVPMIYHVYDNNNVLDCHHCNFKTKVPEICPKCKSPKIKFFGAGVDKIEKEVERLFPKARIRKVDAKSLSNKDDYIKLHKDIKDYKIDILIGTQILAKGLDIPAVDLVGVISADTGLHLPYYRAGEKVFSLITQVSGRSGRKDNVGQTIIQTYWPDSCAVLLAAKHDYHTFYEMEIKDREKLDYPPFCHLVRVVSENTNEGKAKSEIESIAGKLKENKINFIGPAKCFLSRINNKYRYHLIIKTENLPNPKITGVFKTNPYLVWDVDPVDLL